MPDDCNQTKVLDEAQAICRARGGRLTRQRRAVLQGLLNAGHPMTAYELLDLIRPADPAVTPASTYRSLDFLVEMGLAHRLESLKAFLACQHPADAHAGEFLICRRCGTVVETEDPQLANATKRLGHRHGFTLEHRTVELTGVCEGCREVTAHT